MRNTKLVVAIGAAVALAAAPLMTATSASAASGTNSGSAAAHGTMVAGTSAACNKQLNQPSKYPTGMNLADPSGLSDFTPVSELDGVKFSPTLEKRSVPGSWATWGAPPDTETATPHILYTVGATSITITLPKKSKVAGMEVEPNPFEEHVITAVFMKGSGAEKCTASVTANGSAGAKLLAAKKIRGTKKITVSSDVDFSIAQVRWK